MISLRSTNIKDFTSHLFLKNTFDHFSFIEGEIITYNTFRIDGHIQKEFFDSDAELPEYSYWKNIRGYCFSLIKGKRAPLSFSIILGLPPHAIRKLTAEAAPSYNFSDIRGLYLNIRYDGEHLTCVTGISLNYFTMDRTLEHMWDEEAKKILKEYQIDVEQ